MIETFKDRSTGKVFPNQTVTCEFYVFRREDMLREQDKAPNVVCVLTGDWSGVQIDNDAQRVRIEPIRFILPDGNKGRTLEDFLAAEVELPENIGDFVDESQIEKVRRDAYILNPTDETQPDKRDSKSGQAEVHGEVQHGIDTETRTVVYHIDADRLYRDSVAYNEKLKTHQYVLLINEHS